MAGSKEYIHDFGNVTYEMYPFCDADALLLSQVFYMPFENAVTPSFDEEPVPLAKAEAVMHGMMGNKFRKLGLLIPKDGPVNLHLMAQRPRFSCLKVIAVDDVFSTDPPIQYGAGTFILPDGSAVIVYRGTDDTIAGWKEDLDIYTRKGTPAYGFALSYLQNVASKFDGKIYICGHSKGGNIALHTALTCNDVIRSRIAGLFNFDGPGYYDGSLFSTDAYKQIKPVYRHFVPSDSMVGMMLAHDNDYYAVASTMHLGAFQHDLGTWKIDNGELEILSGTDRLSKVFDSFLRGVCAAAGENVTMALDEMITGVIEGMDKLTLTDVAAHPLSTVMGGVRAFADTAPEIKQTSALAFKGAGKILKAALRS